MTPDEIIHKTIYRGCVSSGIDELGSKRAADEGLSAFKKNTFSGKPIDLIESKIKEAKRLFAKKKKEKSS